MLFLCKLTARLYLTPSPTSSFAPNDTKVIVWRSFSNLTRAKHSQFRDSGVHTLRRDQCSMTSGNISFIKYETVVYYPDPFPTSKGLEGKQKKWPFENNFKISLLLVLFFTELKTWRRRAYVTFFWWSSWKLLWINKAHSIAISWQSWNWKAGYVYSSFVPDIAYGNIICT